MKLRQTNKKVSSQADAKTNNEWWK